MEGNMTGVNNANQPLLSICIPTYNRAGFLQEALGSILAQVTGSLANEIEIVISDNASPDETGAVVERIRQKTRTTINYFRNDRNVGFDGNILLAVGRARGRYVWLMGDDDLLAEGALEHIVREIKTTDGVDLFFGEKEDFLLTPDRPVRTRKIMRLGQAAIFDFHDRNTADKYFRENKKLIAYCNFLSNLVFRRESWLKVANKEAFVGTEYIHVYVFQSILWGGEPGVMKYLPQPLIKRRWGNDPPTGAEFRLLKDIKMYRRIAGAVFRDRKYRRAIDEMVIRNDGYSWAVRAKIADRWRFYFKTFPLMLVNYWSFPIFWWKIAPLLVIPNFVLRSLRGLYRKFIKGEPISALEMFEA
jgi:abequosyltransferase